MILEMQFSRIFLILCLLKMGLTLYQRFTYAGSRDLIHHSDLYTTTGQMEGRSQITPSVFSLTRSTAQRELIDLLINSNAGAKKNKNAKNQSLLFICMQLVLPFIRHPQNASESRILSINTGGKYSAKKQLIFEAQR